MHSVHKKLFELVIRLLGHPVKIETLVNLSCACKSLTFKPLFAR